MVRLLQCNPLAHHLAKMRVDGGANCHAFHDKQVLYVFFVQKKPVTVFRDYNRDAILDWNNGREETGLFGINLHKAGANTQDIGKYSAGCQVFQNVSDFEEFMNLARKHKKLHGNTFTYTLIDQRAYKRRLRRFLVYGLVLTSVLTFSVIGYKRFKK